MREKERGAGDERMGCYITVLVCIFPLTLTGRVTYLNLMKTTQHVVMVITSCMVISQIHPFLKDY